MKTIRNILIVLLIIISAAAVNAQSVSPQTGAPEYKYDFSGYDYGDNQQVKIFTVSLASVESIQATINKWLSGDGTTGVKVIIKQETFTTSSNMIFIYHYSVVPPANKEVPKLK